MWIFRKRRKLRTLQTHQSRSRRPKQKITISGDAVQDKKTEFERNTDVDFSEVPTDKDSNIPFDRVQTSGNDNTEQNAAG